ncbi:MAG: transglutaminase domain-containing protein [Ardenticatenaceae bacterium]|nr:transglutaminase domain-containing protein [Anaerolineales bacterium]MCB9009718.1 transglutaminase domain-containing protein [Ardenticatenaceae bacterium]
MRIRPKLEEGWSTLILLWAMIMVSAMAIAQADLIFGLHVIPLVGTIAILAGTLLAKSRFTPNNAHLFSLVYGLFAVFLIVGTVDTFAGMPWRDRILHPTDGIISRQLIWLQKLVSGGTSRDGLIFVFQTSLIYWGLGYTAAWYTFRLPRVWRVVIPTGLVLLSVVYYYAGPRPLQMYLALYLLLAMLFVARTYLVEQEKGWLASSVRYEKRIWFNFVRAGFIASLLALVFAWGLPPLSASATVGDALNGARGPWREFQDNWTRMFSALRTYGTNTTDPYQDTLVLGGPRTVGNTAVMDIIVPRELPYVYWQAKVYHTYKDGGGWDSLDDPFTEHFPDEGPINLPFTADREVITQTVISYLPNSSLIYGAPDIIDVDRPINVYASRDTNGNQLVSQVRAKFVLQLGDQYEVTSRLSLADASSLRDASTEYPDWVRQIYLQLPDSITPETLDLAEELTAPHDNPFDKAIAVRDYLRENIVYNDQIQATPDGIDPVHYTLFVSQEAYCNYYASAMAVMLRSQGVPARVVGGYAQGSFDPETSSYRVQASNSHTWVEVFFPEYGWIQFEPTASVPAWDRPETVDESGGGGDAFSNFSSQALLNREELLGEDLENPNDPALNEDLLADLLAEEEAAAAAEPTFWETFPVWQAIGAALVLLVAVVLSYTANEMNKRVEGDVDKSFSRLRSWAGWLGLSTGSAYTPYEQAELLVTAVPEGKEPIRTLTKQFVLKQFSAAKAFEEGFSPLTQWQKLRPILIRQTLSKKMEDFRNRRNNRRRR